MKYVIVILFLLVGEARATNKDVVCLTNLAKDTNTSIEEVTFLLTSCSVKMLEGQEYLLNPELKGIRVKLYPRETVEKELNSDHTMNSDMSETEKAARLITLFKCEEISRNVKKYLKLCKKGLL